MYRRAMCCKPSLETYTNTIKLPPANDCNLTQLLSLNKFGGSIFERGLRLILRAELDKAVSAENRDGCGGKTRVSRDMTEQRIATVRCSACLNGRYEQHSNNLLPKVQHIDRI